MKRVQRKRIKGYKHPPNTKFVTRPTIFGNPFRVEDIQTDNPALSKIEAHQVSVDLFRRWLNEPEQINLVNEAKRVLPEHDYLACWCDLDLPCHADVWIELFESEVEALKQTLFESEERC